MHPLPCLSQRGTSDSTSSLHRTYAPVLDTPGFVRVIDGTEARTSWRNDEVYEVGA